MCILADGDIERAVRDGALRIQPYQASNLTPNGLDLRVAEVLQRDAAGNETRTREGTVTIPPGGWFAIATMETVGLGPDVAAQLWIRSSYGRKGLVGVFGKVEAGFEGTLTIPGANMGPTPVELPIGDRFCQIVFERMHSVPKQLYADRSGNYQGQTGVTLQPLARDDPDQA